MPSSLFRDRLVAVAISIGAFSMEAQAMYARMSEAQLIAASDLIVIGKLTGFAKKPSADGNGEQTVGVVKVERSLKGAKNSTIWLAVPQPGGLKSSSDIGFAPGQTGLWFLRRVSSGGHALYAADHPQRFVAQPQAEDAAKAVSKALK